MEIVAAYQQYDLGVLFVFGPQLAFVGPQLNGAAGLQKVGSSDLFGGNLLKPMQSIST